MSERFFLSTAITTDRVTLGGPEAHHLLHVMRATVGEHVTLFDDSGAEFDAVIDTLNRSDVGLRVDERREVDRELPFSLTVGVALPKGDRQKWLVEKLTELGVSTLVPLETECAVAQPTTSALERLNRATIEAAKQCGRNRLMKIEQPRSWIEWLASAAGIIRDSRRIIAHPGGISLAQLDLTTPQTTFIAIGPEGGLTDSEVAAAHDASWHSVDLGPRILRVETAAVALAAAIALR